MKKIFGWIGNLLRSSKKLIERFVHPSVELVERIKNAVENPVVDIITAIIPGSWDDALIKKVRAALPQILQTLRISEECLTLQTAEEIISCAVKKLRLYNPEGRDAQYHSIATMLTVSLSDGKLSWREAIHLSEEIFQQLYAK